MFHISYIIYGYLSNFATGSQKFLFSKNGQKVRVYRFHFYLKNRKSKKETKTHARRMLPPPPHHLCIISGSTQISLPKGNSEEKLPNVHCIHIKFTYYRFTEPHFLKMNWVFISPSTNFEFAFLPVKFNRITVITRITWFIRIIRITRSIRLAGIIKINRLLGITRTPNLKESPESSYFLETPDSPVFIHSWKF